MKKKISKAIILSILFFFFIIPLLAQERPDALELFKQGRYEEAVSVCKQELKETPKRKDAIVVISWSLVALGRYQEALDYSERGLNIDPSDHRIIANAGEALYYLGRYDEALIRFQDYIKIAPTGERIAIVYYYMGEIFINRGEFVNADIALSTALYHYPGMVEWWVRLGYARERAGGNKEALEAYEQALMLDNNHQDALRGRDRVRLKLTE